MLSRILRRAALFVFAFGIVCACAESTVQAPPQASLPSPGAAISSPVGVATATATPGDAAAPVTPTDVAAGATAAVVIYSQPLNPNGGLLYSSLRDPDGSDTDQWTWDSFAFDTSQTITEVRWKGAYEPARGGSGGPVRDFTVDIYASIPAGIEPDITVPPLAHYEVGGNAGETLAELLAGVQLYDYQFVLPTPFEAAAWTQYWIQIEALQSGAPDWGLAKGMNGDLQYFRRVPGDSFNYQAAPGEAAFDLLGPGLGGRGPDPLATKSPEEVAALIDVLPPVEEIPVNAEGVQELILVVSRSGYTPGHFAVKAGIPVHLTFRQLGYVPGGNILLIHWDSREEIPVVLTAPADTKVVEFTPQRPGDYRFRCPHDWYEGVMTVRQ
jgi:hypothetical protein